MQSRWLRAIGNEILQLRDAVNPVVAWGVPTTGSAYYEWVNSFRWWAAVDSNHVPPRYQHGALPVELAAQGLAQRLEDSSLRR